MTTDPSRIRDLHERLNWERHAQIRALREIAALAIAAAGQVRDVRLDQLEHPQVAESSILFDMILELALGPLASVATRLITKHVTDRLITAVLGKAAEDSRLIEVTTAVAMPMRRGFAVVSVRRRLPEYSKAPDHWRDVWSALASGLAGSSVAIASDQAKKALKSVAQPQAGPFAAESAAVKADPDPTLAQAALTQAMAVPAAPDSPASLVEEAVLRSCAVHEQAIGVVFDSYGRDLADPGLTDEEVAHLDTFLSELAATPGIFGEDARRLRLFFERCIWCLAFPSIAAATTQQVRPAQIGPKGENIGANQVELRTTRTLTISEDLASYLVRRLPHPLGNGLQTFAQHNGSKNLGFTEPWRNKDGTYVKSPYFVAGGAYTELADSFGRMGLDMGNLRKKLVSLTPKVFDKPVRERPRLFGPPAPPAER